MNDTINLPAMLAAGEGYHIEFKENLDKSFIEEVCAFANSGGGKIVLGVSDRGQIRGFPTDNRSRSLVQDALRSLQPNIAAKVSIHANLCVIEVPEGPDKPYACSRGFFIRNGANSQKLTRNEIVEFFQKEGRIRFDELKHERFDFATDFDERAYDEFIKNARISNTIDRPTLLKNLGCMTEDGSLTNAGVLFFARDIDFLLNHAAVVCVLYKGNQKLHILDKKDFKGNIVENINNAILFVQRHTNVEYVIEKVRRREIPALPEVALRESIINAVCHRDYFDHRANVVIEVFDDRVQITNPGGLPSGLKPADFGRRSVARNPVVAGLLHRLNYIEKVGTGISRISASVAESGRCHVEFAYNDFFSVTFTGPESEKVPNKVPNKVPIKVPNKIQGRTVSEILICLRENPEITANDIAGALKISARAIRKHLNQLKADGIIKRIGSRKSGKWKILSTKVSESSPQVPNKVPNKVHHNFTTSSPPIPYRVRHKTAEDIIENLRADPQITAQKLADALKITVRAVRKHLSQLKQDGTIERVGPNKGGHWKVL